MQPREQPPHRPEQALGSLRGESTSSSSHSPYPDDEGALTPERSPDAAEISAHSQAPAATPGAAPDADPTADPAAEAADPGTTIERAVPPIPSYLLDPRPIVLIGTLIWTLALLGNMLFFDGDMRTVILCAVGVGVGAMGTAVYALQRRAVLRGAKGAQVGLDFDQP